MFRRFLNNPIVAYDEPYEREDGTGASALPTNQQSMEFSFMGRPPSPTPSEWDRREQKYQRERAEAQATYDKKVAEYEKWRQKTIKQNQKDTEKARRRAARKPVVEKQASAQGTPLISSLFKAFSFPKTSNTPNPLLSNSPQEAPLLDHTPPLHSQESTDRQWLQDNQESQEALLAHIESSLQLRQYRDNFKRAAHSLLHSASALLPQPGRPDVQVGAGSSISAKALNAAGAVAEILPFPGSRMLGKTIQYAGTKISEHDFNEINSNLSRLVQPHEVNAFCDSIANSATLLQEHRLRDLDHSPSIREKLHENIIYFMSRVDGTAAPNQEETLEEKCATNDACALLIELAHPQFKGIGLPENIPFNREPLSEKIDIAMQHFCRQQNDHAAWENGAPPLEPHSARIIKRIPSREQLNALQKTIGVHTDQIEEHRDDIRDIRDIILEEKSKRKAIQKQLLQNLAELDLSDTESQVTEIFNQRRSERGTRASINNADIVSETREDFVNRTRGQYPDQGFSRTGS